MNISEAKAFEKYIDAIINNDYEGDDREGALSEEGLDEVIKAIVDMDFSGESKIKLTLKNNLMKTIKNDMDECELDDEELDYVAAGLNPENVGHRDRNPVPEKS